MLIYDFNHLQFQKIHCQVLITVLLLTTFLLIVSWSIPQSVYWVSLTNCVVINVTSFNQSTCDPVCQCNETPLYMLPSLPLCSNTTTSGTYCQNGPLCCHTCCNSCTTCSRNICQTFSCDCNCCAQVQNDYCIQSCTIEKLYTCQTNLNNISTVTDYDYPLGSVFRCNDVSVVSTFTMYPWSYFTVPAILLVVTIAVSIPCWLYFRKEISNGVV